jgi:oxygen-independent coproporphyrinogen III oxidase
MEPNVDFCMEDSPLGIYFHIPFCASVCEFCAFYHEKPYRKDIDCYLDGMNREISLIGIDQKITTVFWGGGTPGVLSARKLEQLGVILLNFLKNKPVEWTVEMAPSTVKEDKIKVLCDLGVTRISLGVQSFQKELLKQLGRQHNCKQTYKAIDIIRNQGILNLNLDIIISIPGQSKESLLKDLHEAVQISPDHISAYHLSFEENTPLYKRFIREEIRKRTEEEEIILYETTRQTLESNGYAQYEISNYARPGKECLHHLNTWNLYEWIGFGPSACTQYQGLRYANINHLSAWIKGLEKKTPHRIDQVKLTPELLATDCLIFGLRMNKGINLNTLTKRFPELNWNSLTELWNNLQEQGFMKKSAHSNLSLTDKGRLVADRIAVQILDLF